jgi:hypothetical protein
MSLIRRDDVCDVQPGAGSVGEARGALERGVRGRIEIGGCEYPLELKQSHVNLLAV